MRTAQAGFKTGKGGETPSDLLARVGPTLRVDIGLRYTSLGPPDLLLKKQHALIDTGAGADCIDEVLAQRLGLPVINRVEFSGVGGKTEADVYMVRLYVPELDRRMFEPFVGVRLEQGEQTHRIILGRGFLRPYQLHYDGLTGAVEIREP